MGIFIGAAIVMIMDERDTDDEQKWKTGNGANGVSKR
jgi:hypothetical protein